MYKLDDAHAPIIYDSYVARHLQRSERPPNDAYPHSRSCPQEILTEMKAEIEAAHLPILHFSVDMWTSKTQGKKFLGLHVFFVNRDFELRDALLAVSPSVP